MYCVFKNCIIRNIDWKMGEFEKVVVVRELVYYDGIFGYKIIEKIFFVVVK